MFYGLISCQIKISRIYHQTKDNIDRQPRKQNKKTSATNTDTSGLQMNCHTNNNVPINISSIKDKSINRKRIFSKIKNSSFLSQSNYIKADQKMTYPAESFLNNQDTKSTPNN